MREQFVFDPPSQKLSFAGSIPCRRIGDGPRYVVFHPSMNVCYCVNELSSTISVYRYDSFMVLQNCKASYIGNAAAMSTSAKSAQQPNVRHHPTLHPLQELPTVPSAFPRKLNTCGRIAVDPSGNWVLVSNRGHDSITVYRVTRNTAMGENGLLSLKGYYHTAGVTPRHFKFSSTGAWLLAANQDSDNISVFRFDHKTGDLEFRRRYSVLSPNFIEIMNATDSGAADTRTSEGASHTTSKL